MTQQSLTRAQAADAVAALEVAIANGAIYPFPKGVHGRSAMREAAQAMGLSRPSMRHRIDLAKRIFGLGPGLVPAEPATPKHGDAVVAQRRADELQRLRREHAEMARELGKAQDLRRQVFKIARDPVAPIAFPARDSAAPHAETIVLFLSDLHWGEAVDLAAMDGLNSYSLATARARLGRWTQAVSDLATKHWSGPAPERIILLLGGDMVSGEIHAELAKTNEALALPAVRDLVQHLTAAIRLIRRTVQCPIDIISLPGNHGRSTLKPESKLAAETSYDTLVADFLESTLAGDAGIAFFKPVSGDAVFSVYGWTVFATHGDRIGSRGGQGFIGPAGTAARGFKRIVADYAARGVILDLLLAGHFHTPLQIEEGFINGSLPGPTEYSRDGRFRPHPAQQLFLAMHPRRKVTQVRWIHVGAADEGALYEAPPETSRLRPRYRVRAVSEAAS